MVKKKIFEKRGWGKPPLLAVCTLVRRGSGTTARTPSRHSLLLPWWSVVGCLHYFCWRSKLVWRSIRSSPRRFFLLCFFGRAFRRGRQSYLLSVRTAFCRGFSVAALGSPRKTLDTLHTQCKSNSKLRATASAPRDGPDAHAGQHIRRYGVEQRRSGGQSDLGKSPCLPLSGAAPGDGCNVHPLGTRRDTQHNDSGYLGAYSSG